MLNLHIGLQAINGGSIRQVAAHQSFTSVDLKVRAVGKNLHSSTCPGQPRRERLHKFSPLRFLWLASLMMGARAQQVTPFPASMNLSSLSGSDGFVLNGEQATDQSGTSVASVGDLNGDGIYDLVIGAPGATSGATPYAGKSYVVFGRAWLGNSDRLQLSSLNGTSGFVLMGEQTSDISGFSVASAGDVNGDGTSDLVIGAYQANSNAGKSYVVFGRSGLGSSGSLSLSSLNGTNFFVLNGEQLDDRSGFSVASAGDVNGDGIADLVIGAPYANSVAGKSYVVFGRTGLGSSGSLALSSLNGTNGFVLNGADDGSGYSVANAGDVNRDGIADLIIGAPYANSHTGKSYVVFGRAGIGSSGSLALSSLNGTSGFVLMGEQAEDFSGHSVASAGDVNGDGTSDLLIGANGANSNTGKSYVVFGSAGLGSSGSLSLSSLNGTNGFVFNGEQLNDRCGFSVASAGDVNGDGIADLVIGAPYANSVAGKSYVVFGRAGLGSSGSLVLSSLNGTSGFVLNGENANDTSGTSVASAGDVNGDGIVDLVIGASQANSKTGKSYVVFGRISSNATFLTTLPPTSGQVTSTFSITGSVVLNNSSFSASTLDIARSSSSSTVMKSFSQTASSPLVASSHSGGSLPIISGSLPIIIGLAVAVAALACSLLSGGLFYFRKKRNFKNSIMKENGALPAGYTSIEAIQQGMVSARANDQSLNVLGGQPEGHYSNLSDMPQANAGEQYNQVSITQLNAELDQDREVVLK